MMRNSGRSYPVPSCGKRTTTPPAEVSSCGRTLVTLGGLRIVQVRTPLDELADDRIGGLLEFVDGADLADAAVEEHRDARADAIGAAHVVRDDDARDAEAVAHPDHELVDDGA